MPKPPLRGDLSSLERDIVEALIEGLHEWRSDLRYPESHSDMRACVRGLLKKFEVQKRLEPLERLPLRDWEPCLNCGKLTDRTRPLCSPSCDEEYRHP